MTTTDTVLLIVLAALMIVFFLLCIAVTVIALKLLASVRRVVYKAEDVVDSVESATEVLKDTRGRLALFKLVRNVIKLAHRRRK